VDILTLLTGLGISRQYTPDASVRRWLAARLQMLRLSGRTLPLPAYT
jgi:hypothetical protein